MFRIFTSLLTVASMLAVTLTSYGAPTSVGKEFDLTKLRYRIDSPSVFHNQKAMETAKINQKIVSGNSMERVEEFQNPSPVHSFMPSNITGNIDAPDNQIWYYTGQLEYEEIPPHDDIIYTDRILRSYTFDIYDSDMALIGEIKDNVEYLPGEVRVPFCEVTPVATRNFFNTDDKIEIIVGMAFNIEYGGNNYRSIVYSINGEKDSEGMDVPVYTIDNLVGDVAEGPSTDGSDNFYITFTDDFDTSDDDADFWDYLIGQKAAIEIYGKALDNNGPRKLFSTNIPLIQLPGDQENIPALISMRNGDDVIFCISYYKEPFYNRYDNPLTDDMTQREGNSLIIDLYKASENSIEKYTSTSIPVVRDPMPNSEGDETCLFSFYSVGSLTYRDDFLFDAPGVQPGKPDYIITRGNYQISTDGIVNSYFTYKHDGTLKNTLFLYADGFRDMGNLNGYEPQVMFVSKDAYGYLYNFVDIYSGEVVAEIPADYYYDDNEEPELITANMARVAVDDSYMYVSEMRYPGLDAFNNDLMRFIWLDREGSFDHFDYVNMGKGVEYAQSYLSTEALQKHAYTISDTPAYMMLVKRGYEDSLTKTEELIVAEIETEQNPEGTLLLQLGPGDNGALSSIVPEFPTDDTLGRLLVYYYKSEDYLYTLDVYNLPLNDPSGIMTVTPSDEGFKITDTSAEAEGLIKVIDLRGVVVESGYGHVDLSTLSKGVYVIVAGDKTAKIIK